MKNFSFKYLVIWERLIILLVLIIFLNITIYGQTTFPMSCGSTGSGMACPTTSICPRVVGIRIVYVLKDDGTGNFTETTDPNGSSAVNGYQHATAITNQMNTWFASNTKIWLPSGNTIPVNPINISFQLLSTGFIRSTTFFNENFFNGSPGAQQSYAQTQNYLTPNVFTIFIIRNRVTSAGEGTGIASTIGVNQPINAFCKIYDAQLHYSYGGTWWQWGTGTNVMHELGHLLNLSHPWEDPCPDTYSPSYTCWQQNIPATPECNDLSNITNLYMAYSVYAQSVSPCEIQTMHNYLASSMGSGYVTNGAQASFILPTTYYATYCNGSLNKAITLYASPTSNETNYKIDLEKLSSDCSTTILSSSTTGWLAGQVPDLDLRTKFTLGPPPTYYRLTLRAKNSSCNLESNRIQCFKIFSGGPCSMSIAANPILSGNTLRISTILPIADAIGIEIYPVNNNSKVTQILPRVLIPEGFLEKSFPLKGFSPGVYVVNLVGTYNSLSEKLIIK